VSLVLLLFCGQRKLKHVFAIEPMVNLGTHEVVVADDGWTASAADGLPSAHFEHVVAITRGEPRSLTMFEEEIDA